MTTETTHQPLPRRSESGMQTRAINAAAGVLQAAMEQGRQTPTGLAIALDSARLLNSPETAAEFEKLRGRVAELEYVAPSPSCTRCYGADAERFVAQGGVTAACPVCGPSELEQMRARVAELEAARPATPPPVPPAGTVRIIADVTNTDNGDDARYAESRVEYALEQYGYEAQVWLDTDGADFFQPGHAYTHRPGADTIGGPRLRFYCESVTTDRDTGRPVARGWGGRRYGDRWTSVQHTRGLEDWQSGQWVDTPAGGDQ